MQLERDFAALAHRHQDPPAAARGGGAWSTWLVLGGRGAGKTRLGAEWVRAAAHAHGPYAAARSRRIALVGESEHDVRAVMIEGTSGILAVSPRGERPAWTVSRRRLEWRNGAVAECFSADDPESLRGPQFDAAWCDELAKWRYAQAAFDMLQFGLRLSAHPRQVITTTPRPIPLIRKLLQDPHAAVTRAATQANATFLSPVFLREIVGRYGGTRLGRQELDGEVIEERPDALWSRAMLERCRVPAAPALARLVVGVDPPTTPRGTCGLVAAGRDEDGFVYVLEDATVSGLGPAEWARAAVALYRRLKANTLVAEVNQGGDMVREVLRHVEPTVPVKSVHTNRGKYRRAEPIAAVYEQGKAKHVDPPPRALEDQMCDFGPDGLSGGGSPDRVDALVWALTELTAPQPVEPRIRRL
jgi:phage terminase large subunit-like protein